MVGLLIALWGRDLFPLFIPDVPQQVAINIAFNARVIGFAALLTALTAVVFGLVPALRATTSGGTDIVSALKEEGRGAGAGRSNRPGRSPRLWRSEERRVGNESTCQALRC